MITKEQLIARFAGNLSVIQRQCSGLTHADSVLQLPFRGNCLNWVLGHIADTRNSILRSLGRAPIMTEAEAKRYAHGSEPVTCDGEGVLKMEDLLARLERAQPEIEAGLLAATPEQLAVEGQFAARKMTVGERIFFLYYHETYHTGQTELLRQLAGKNDKII